MGIYLGIPILALAVVLQTTFIPQIRIFSGEPDLAFLIVLAWSVHSRLEQNVTWAFFGGIMQDLMSAAPLGTSIPGLLIVVFAMDYLKRQLYGVSLPLIILMVLIGTVIAELTFIVIITLSGFRVQLVETLTYVVLPTMGYNLLFFGPIYGFVRLIQRWFSRDEPVFTRDLTRG